MDQQVRCSETIREVAPATRRKVIAQNVYVAPGGRNLTRRKINAIERESRIMGEAIARINGLRLEDVSTMRYDGY
jgi:hypothetical protein